MAESRGQRIADRLRRRDWLRISTGAALAGSVSGWFDCLAARASTHPVRRRSCILLWMSGGPSQLDTFDLKPGHANGGEFKAIETSVAGMRISEHLPKLAQRAQHLAVVRSMSTKEGDHGRATYLLHTGYVPGGAIRYPALGPLLAKQLCDPASDLPSCVSIGVSSVFNSAALGPGFLGPRYAPLFIGRQGSGPAPANDQDMLANRLKVPSLALPPGVAQAQAAARYELLSFMEGQFAPARDCELTRSRQAAYERALRMMRPETAEAFDLSGEPDTLRDAYGRNLFGQGCLLARRLVERGVPFIEVALDGVEANGFLGWDSHQDNFSRVKALSAVLDGGWSTLMDDLKSRGLLESTMVVWMGEFGRTPQINGNAGRDHFPAAWSTALCGGAVRGGQVIGRTSPDGMSVEDRPVSVPDFLATICRGLELDPMERNTSNVGRPIRLVDPDAKPIEECLL